MKVYKIYKYDNITKKVETKFREVYGFSNVIINEDEVLYIDDIKCIPPETLKNIELCYKIKIPPEIKIQVYMKSNKNKYVYFKLHNIYYMHIILEEYEKIPHTKAYQQILRLQSELKSMSCSAGYDRDYLKRKFKNDYDDIMVTNHGDNK